MLTEKEEWLPRDGERSVWICLGEAGSGKTELSVNLALKLAARSEKTVLFDMDATKACFRTRDYAEALAKKKIDVRSGNGDLDSPVVPPGLAGAVENEELSVVMDVGGNIRGALSLGQYAEAFRKKRVHVLYVFNPFRSFQRSPEKAWLIRRGILEAAGLSASELVINPVFGAETTKEDVKEGFTSSLSLWQKEIPLFTMIPDWIGDPEIESRIFRVHPFMPGLLHGKEVEADGIYHSEWK